MTKLVDRYDMYIARAHKARSSKLYCKWVGKAQEALKQIKVIDPSFDPSL